MNVGTSEDIRVVEFCAGYGGIHLGLKRAIPNLRVIAFSEIEAFAVANLVAKMEEGLVDPAPIWTDIKTFPGLSFRGHVDILVAGFPCQPFSAAGKRNGDEDPRHLFPYIKQTVIDMQPEFVFLENVEGIISAKLKGDGWNDPEGTSVLLHVLRELERVGYTTTAGVFSAAEVGAPHRRKRVFIMAHNKRKRVKELNRRISGKQEQCSSRNTCSSVWPSRPGEEQHEWEPPRVMGVTKKSDGWKCDRHREVTLGRTDTGRVQTQPPMGRDTDGLTGGLDYAGLYESCDNRTDELRLLGNGVVPATAERAWRVLSDRMENPRGPRPRNQG